MKHAIKIEDLDLSKNEADQLETVCHNFLRETGYSNDRIETIECRRRDGFIPHSHNKGGLEARSYLDQHCLPNGNTGFDNTDKILEKYYQYNLDSYLQDNDLKELDESHYESFDDYCLNGEDTIEFMTRIMFNSESECTVHFFVSASDSPYHRQHDDYFEHSIEFKNASDLKKQLDKLNKESFIKCFKNNLREAF